MTIYKCMAIYSCYLYTYPWHIYVRVMPRSRSVCVSICYTKLSCYIYLTGLRVKCGVIRFLMVFKRHARICVDFAENALLASFGVTIC